MESDGELTRRPGHATFSELTRRLGHATFSELTRRLGHATFSEQALAPAMTNDDP
jgi:hypothetical protein